MCALPLDLRKRVVARYERGGMTYTEIAETFGIGEASVSRLLRRSRERGNVERDPRGGGNPPLISEQELPLLVQLVAEKPDRTVAELCEAWTVLHGVELSDSSMKRALARAGMTRKKRHSDRQSRTARTSKRSAARSSKK